MAYTFTLRYALAPEDDDHDALVERLGACGCDDALVGIGQTGRLALAFTREADHAEAAVCSALQDVKRAIPTARLVEATPDLVGLTEVADLVGVSRQNMRKLMLAHPVSFPSPVHEGSTSIWHLAEVLSWLSARGRYSIDEGLLEVSKVVLQLNLANEALRRWKRSRRPFDGLIA